MRARLAQTILIAAGRLAKRLDPQNVTITVTQKPPIGGAADRAERFAKTGDINILTEGLD